MNCPHCNGTIEKVAIISRCWQFGELNDNGKIEDYGSIEEILDTISIHCPKCDGDLTELVMES